MMQLDGVKRLLPGLFFADLSVCLGAAAGSGTTQQLIEMADPVRLAERRRCQVVHRECRSDEYEALMQLPDQLKQCARLLTLALRQKGPKTLGQECSDPNTLSPPSSHSTFSLPAR